MKKEIKIFIIESIVSAVLLGLLVNSAYSLWYIFYGTDSGWDVHLYTLLSGMALGWFSYLFVKAVTKKGGKLKIILSFISGNVFFQTLIWGINSKVNTSATDNELVVIKSYTVTFILTALFLFAAFVLRAKKHTAANIIFAVAGLFVCAGSLYNFNAENIRALEYKKNIEFETISAEQMMLTADEKSCSKAYFEHYFIGNEVLPLFTFKVDGEKFDPSQWNKKIDISHNEKGAVYQGGNTVYVIYTNDEKALEVTVEATLFEDNATFQWKVFIKNTGTANSGVISDFYAFDYILETGKADLYYSLGSNTAASDFSIVRKKLTSSVKTFSGVDGKPTEKNLPYFNISGEAMGCVLAIGWTGQWQAGFTQSGTAVAVTVRQENLEAYLLPGEEIRSPLVSLGFYNSDNALAGFNLFRNWVMDNVYPENITKNYYTVMEVAGPMSTRTSDEIIEILDTTSEAVYENTDAFWMDAGWYSYNEGWYDGVGNWTVDTSRYDNGIIELSSYAREKGLGHVLWYEPERVYPGTIFHSTGAEHEQWLIDIGGENLMWNLADEEALIYYCDYILSSLKENGVTVYRQDFNFAPLEYWQKADREYYDGRTGICENHYVTNLYRFLDYLTENIEGLIIDNCASGGKRLDLEMTYRSIPFWRSDYNCAYHSDLFEATQSHTYGLSFWLPLSGSAVYMQDEYSMRSDIMPLMLMDFYANYHPDFGFYNEQRALMTESFYPLESGSFDKNRILAMEYASADGLEGVAFIYKRSAVKDNEYTVKLNGLVPDKIYQLYDIDNPDKIYSVSGDSLMNDGFTISLPDGEKAIILMFSAE